MIQFDLDEARKIESQLLDSLHGQLDDYEKSLMQARKKRDLLATLNNQLSEETREGSYKSEVQYIVVFNQKNII